MSYWLVLGFQVTWRVGAEEGFERLRAITVYIVVVRTRWRLRKSKEVIEERMKVLYILCVTLHSDTRTALALELVVVMVSSIRAMCKCKKSGPPVHKKVIAHCCRAIPESVQLIAQVWPRICFAGSDDFSSAHLSVQNGTRNSGIPANIYPRLSRVVHVMRFSLEMSRMTAVKRREYQGSQALEKCMTIASTCASNGTEAELKLLTMGAGRTVAGISNIAP